MTKKKTAVKPVKKVDPNVEWKKEIDDLVKKNGELEKMNKRQSGAIDKLETREIQLSERFEADKAVIYGLKRANKQMDTVVEENEKLRDIIESKDISVAKKIQAFAVPSLANKARVIKTCLMIEEDPDSEFVKDVIGGIRNYIDGHCK